MRPDPIDRVGDVIEQMVVGGGGFAGIAQLLNQDHRTVLVAGVLGAAFGIVRAIRKWRRPPEDGGGGAAPRRSPRTAATTGPLSPSTRRHAAVVGVVLVLVTCLIPSQAVRLPVGVVGTLLWAYGFVLDTFISDFEAPPPTDEVRIRA